MAREVDPTRTATARNAMLTQMRVRFGRLARAIHKLVVTDDAFGLGPGAVQVTANTRWQFSSDAGKLQLYRDWFRQQVEAGILIVPEVTPGGTPWMATHIRSSYLRGVVRAYTDSHKLRPGDNADFYKGGQAEFLRSSFAGPILTRKLEILHTRAYSELKGVTDSMGQEMGRVLADGLAGGRSAAQISKTLTDSVGTLTRTRANAIARTEIIHAHAEGQLDSYQAIGVKVVGVQVEWLTARDGKVCPRCNAMSGKVFTIEESRGKIPLHPNCRCAWMPANVGEGTNNGPELRRAQRLSRQAEQQRLRDAAAAAG